MKTETEKELQELDILCAEKVMTWRVFTSGRGSVCCEVEGGGIRIIVTDHPWESSEWNPTTNPADAMAVLERCAEKCGVIKIVKLGYWWVNDNQKSCEGKADTLPLAICNFAKALYSK